MLPRRPGSYVLVLRTTRPEGVSVGKLGDFSLPAGCYAYAGSARGPGGLGARVARHVSRKKACHWHIDYLRGRAELLACWYALGVAKRECQWASALSQLPTASIPAPGFGASDCRCPAHLIHFAVRPRLSRFAKLVEAPILSEWFAAPDPAGCGV